jgi:hypothetical protein
MRQKPSMPFTTSHDMRLISRCKASHLRPWASRPLLRRPPPQPPAASCSVAGGSRR